jgi:hypothetical protein
MSSIDQAIQKQLSNLQKRCGKTLEELNAIVKASGLTKHGEIREMLKREAGMGHGDANTFIVAIWNKGGASIPQPKSASAGQVLDEIYQGQKAALRPIHEKLMEAIGAFGEFETAPKKGYVSLRRKKQFAMLGPATNTRFELGLNMKGVPGTGRLEELAEGGMCSHKVKLTSTDEVDALVIAWARQAYDSAG